MEEINQMCMYVRKERGETICSELKHALENIQDVSTASRPPPISSQNSRYHMKLSNVFGSPISLSPIKAPKNYSKVLRENNFRT